jgi:peroxiredoxin
MEELGRTGRLKAMRIESARSFVTAALATALMLTASAAAQESEILQKSERTPRFAFKTEHGKRVTPTSFGGKLLVLNFWETACAPCVKELPSLSDFARVFRSKGVVVVAVGGDEDGEKYQGFLTDHHVQLETYRDPTRRISKAFGTDAFPETYLIRKGRIIGKVVGGIDWTGRDISSFVQERLGRN